MLSEGILINMVWLAVVTVGGIKFSSTVLACSATFSAEEDLLDAGQHSVELTMVVCQ